MRLTAGSTGYESNFQSVDVNGRKQDYKVIFFNVTNRGIVDENFNLIMKLNMADIQFQGPDSYDITYNAVPIDVYGKVLYAVKLYLEKAHPVAFSFSPFKEQMALVYDKFVNRFLRDWLQVNKGVFLQRDYVETMPEDKREKLKKSAELLSNEKVSILKGIRDRKKQKRINGDKGLQCIGRFLAVKRMLYGSYEATVCFGISFRGGERISVMLLDGNHTGHESYKPESVDIIQSTNVAKYSREIEKLVRAIELDGNPMALELLMKPRAREILDIVRGVNLPPSAPRPGLIVPPGYSTSPIRTPVIRGRCSRNVSSPGQLTLPFDT